MQVKHLYHVLRDYASSLMPLMEANGSNALLITGDIFNKNMLDFSFIFLSRGFNISIFCSSFELLGRIVTEK